MLYQVYLAISRIRTHNFSDDWQIQLPYDHDHDGPLLNAINSYKQLWIVFIFKITWDIIEIMIILMCKFNTNLNRNEIGRWLPKPFCLFSKLLDSITHKKSSYIIYLFKPGLNTERMEIMLTWQSCNRISFFIQT